MTDGSNSDDLDRGIPQLPRTRSGRIPQWAIDEALGVPHDPSSWRAPAPSGVGQRRPGYTGGGGDGGDGGGNYGRRHRTSGRRGPRRWLSAVMVLFFVALVGGMTAWTMGLRGSKGAPPLADHTGWFTTYTHGPTPGVGSHDEPLGTPAPLDHVSDSYRLFSVNGAPVGGGAVPSGTAGTSADADVAVQTHGHAVLESDGLARQVGAPQPHPAYDPCRPIHYVVQQSRAPKNGAKLIAAAIDKASTATGLEFVDDGTTDELPSRERKPFQPHRYGDRWAPVLIAWTTPQQVPRLGGDVVGLGGSVAVTVSGRSPVYVSGQIELDTPQITELLRRDGGAAQARAIIEHELGHVLGLAHVPDPSQLMYPTTRPGITGYQDGDLTGLSILGQGRCAPEL